MKATREIAEIRSIPERQDSISPNRHHDIGSVRELGIFIGRVRAITGFRPRHMTDIERGVGGFRAAQGSD